MRSIRARSDCSCSNADGNATTREPRCCSCAVIRVSRCATRSRMSSSFASMEPQLPQDQVLGLAHLHLQSTRTSSTYYDPSWPATIPKHVRPGSPVARTTSSRSSTSRRRSVSRRRKPSSPSNSKMVGIHPGALLDLLIRIDELPLQEQCQPPSHRALTGPHRPTNTMFCMGACLRWSPVKKKLRGHQNLDSGALGAAGGASLGGSFGHRFAAPCV
jgi:hypothetical protein